MVPSQGSHIHLVMYQCRGGLVLVRKTTTGLTVSTKSLGDFKGTLVNQKKDESDPERKERSLKGGTSLLSVPLCIRCPRVISWQSVWDERGTTSFLYRPEGRKGRGIN